jgi:hypothetical protein
VPAPVAANTHVWNAAVVRMRPARELNNVLGKMMPGERATTFGAQAVSAGAAQ